MAEAHDPRRGTDGAKAGAARGVSDGAPAPRPPRRRLRLAVTLLALPAGLGLVELGVRASGRVVAPLPELRGALTERVDDPDLLFENRAGARATVVYRERPGAPPRLVEMTTNAARFRGPAVPLAPSDGVPRVACLGDSHTFGYGVPDGETWPDHLRARASGPVEVLNAGVTAYDTLQEVLWFERRVDAFDPDVVVLQYYLNDTAVRGLAGGEPDALVAWTHPRRGGTVGRLRARWRTLDLACDAVFRHRSLRAYATDRTAHHTDGHPGWERGKAALLRLRDHCAARGRYLVVALYPYLVEEGAGFRSDAALEVVRAFCAAHDIPCVDAAPALRAAGGGALRISPIDYHGNGDAHRAFAGVVAEVLSARGLPFAAGDGAR